VAIYLIDSHIFLWAIDAPGKLRAAERRVLEDANVDVAVSVASFWELSIKLTKGSLDIRNKKSTIVSDYFARQAAIAGFSILTIEPPEAEYVRALPNIHSDPFDRLLIAQALLRGRMVMTRDTVFAHYPGIQIRDFRFLIGLPSLSNLGDFCRSFLTLQSNLRRIW
jgi:PIN domain nuclease of toxin-antitoxin system